MSPTVLVACVGNIFLSDDGFGVEVFRALCRRSLPPAVRLIDVGIRGLDLVYQLLDGYNGLIIVDTVRRGGEAGTLYVIEPDIAADPLGTIGSHDVDPHQALRLAAAWGARECRVRIIGCEPHSIEPGIGLSEPVSAALERAIGIVESQIEQMSRDPAAQSVNDARAGHHTADC